MYFARCIFHKLKIAKEETTVVFVDPEVGSCTHDHTGVVELNKKVITNMFLRCVSSERGWGGSIRIRENQEALED